MDRKILLCKDCVHFSDRTEECLYQVKMDYVHGMKGFYRASVQRNSLSSCGPSAKWFAPIRPNLLQEDDDSLDCIPWGIAKEKE